MTVLDVEDPKEIEYILAVRYFHEYELTDDHLRVAQISLVTFFSPKNGIISDVPSPRPLWEVVNKANFRENRFFSALDGNLPSLPPPLWLQACKS